IQATSLAADQAASDIAAAHPTGEPWKVDGRSWHLEQRCSARTKPIVEAASDIITNAVPEANGPDWGQKRYISWRADNRIWTVISPHRTTVWLAFNGVQLSVEEIGDALGFERHGSNWRSSAGSFVKTNWRGQPGIH